MHARICVEASQIQIAEPDPKCGSRIRASNRFGMEDKYEDQEYYGCRGLF